MKRKILVVDDEEHMLSLLKRALEGDDVAVSVAANGSEALKYFEENDVDLVISDISMPDIQGTDLFFQLKKMNPFAQIIMVTAYPTLEIIAKMLEGGASDFIIKPFDIEQLQSVVHQTFKRVDRWRSLGQRWLEYKKLKGL